MSELKRAIIRIDSVDELLIACDFLEAYGAKVAPIAGAARDPNRGLWQSFQPGGRHEEEGTMCLRIGKHGSVDHSGENYYRGEWREIYNYGDEYVSDDMICISLDEYILACGGTPIGSDFDVACEAEFAELFTYQTMF